MGKKDSTDGETQEACQALFQKKGIGAVLVGEKHQAVGSQIDEGIAQHQRPGGIVKKGGFALAGAR